MLAETLPTWVICLISALPFFVYAHVYATGQVISRPRGQCEFLAGTVLQLLACDTLVPLIFFLIWSVGSIYLPDQFFGTATCAGLCFIYVHAALALVSGPNFALAILPLALFFLRGFRFYKSSLEKSRKTPCAPLTRRFVFGDTFF